jgi:hypothetical protein
VERHLQICKNVFAPQFQQQEHSRRKERKGKEKMQRIVFKSIFASIASLALAASIASAKSHNKSTTIEIVQSAQVPNGPTLQPGTYKVTVLGDSDTPLVGFYQDGKLVGQAAAQLVEQGQKSPNTEARTDNSGGSSVLTEIDVNGWTKKIEFAQQLSATNGSGQ